MKREQSLLTLLASSIKIVLIADHTIKHKKMIKSTATLALAYIAEAAALKEMLAQLDSEQQVAAVD